MHLSTVTISQDKFATMDGSFDFGKRRRDHSSFFSPVKIDKSSRNYYGSTSSFSSKEDEIIWESIIEAIKSNDVDTLIEVLQKDSSFDINRVIPGYPMTLLHLSVGFSENETDIVEILVRRGGDPNNLNIEEKLSPLHLSALYDHDRVMSILINYGGDPKLPNGDGETCYDIVKQNVENELLENCFKYLFARSKEFRKSLGTCLGSSSLKPITITSRKLSPLHESGSDGFYSCESQAASDGNCSQQNEGLHSIARKLFPSEYSYLMTEDESADNDDADEVRKKLTTIPEESGVVSVTSPFLAAFSATPSPLSRPCRGIASMTAPHYLLTDDSISVMSDTEASCVNSTPPMTPQPTKADLQRLQEQMKQLNIPVTPSTFGVISKFTESESRFQALLVQKTGVDNFSIELQAGLQNLNLIHEWGNHKVDFLQNATPTANRSKSFYNYLLLDPKIITRANFSGDHLKTGVINKAEKFQKFLESVFYIGKAHGKRPMNHLVEAKQKFLDLGRRQLKHGEKIDKILEIWRTGLGVIVVSVFHHSSEREANVNEACMIDAMGLIELSNLKKGSYTGTVASSWSQKTKNQLGSFLLFTSFRSFVVSDPKQFYPQDF